MKKLLTSLLILQLVLVLTSCCCPCGKKAAEQNQDTQPQQPEQK